MKNWLIAFLFCLCALAFAGPALAEYVPLIDSTFLDGPKADVQTMGTSFLAIVAILAGVGLLVKALLR